MDAELQQFNQERAERIRELHDKHEKELDHFNEESARMGFRFVFSILVDYSHLLKFLIIFTVLWLWRKPPRRLILTRRAVCLDR